MDESATGKVLVWLGYGAGAWEYYSNVSAYAAWNWGGGGGDELSEEVREKVIFWNFFEINIVSCVLK